MAGGGLVSSSTNSATTSGGRVQHQLGELGGHGRRVHLDGRDRVRQGTGGEHRELVAVPGEVAGRLVHDHQAGHLVLAERLQVLEGHHGSHRPAHQHGPLDAQLLHEGAHVTRVVRNRVPIQDFLRVAVATEVGHDGPPGAPGCVLELRLEEPPAAHHAVQEHHRPALTRLAHVQLHAANRRRHAISLRTRAARRRPAGQRRPRPVRPRSPRRPARTAGTCSGPPAPQG